MKLNRLVIRPSEDGGTNGVTLELDGQPLHMVQSLDVSFHADTPYPVVSMSVLVIVDAEMDIPHEGLHIHEREIQRKPFPKDTEE